MGTAIQSHTSTADAVLLGCLRPELRAEAAVPEPTLEGDTGNEGTGPLSHVVTGTPTGQRVFVHVCVCACASAFQCGRTD